MRNRAEKTAEKAKAKLSIIELEEQENKALDKWRNAGSAVAKAKAWVEVTAVRAKLRDARLVVKPRKGQGGKRRSGGTGVAGFVGALFGG